jgi:hypothetical protein
MGNELAFQEPDTRLLLGNSSTGSSEAVEVSGLETLHAALHATCSLAYRSRERDELWIALWESVTTRGEVWITPIGSGARVRVTSDDADAELIAAWDWLEANEARARRMGPVELYRTLRGVATKSYRGSARSANADSMCGITGVPGGTWIAIGRGPEIERCAS